MKIETILFDLDGTLIDTNRLIYESYKHTFHHYGYHLTDEEILSFNGPPLREVFAAFKNEDTDEMIKEYRSHNLKKHNAYVKAFPHVKETITQLKTRGIKVGIVSTKMRLSVDRGLEVAGLMHDFPVVITMDDVTHAKPNPEPILKGMKALNGSPETTLMVGDNSHDIEGGKNAGVHTAGVEWSAKGAAFLKQYHPTYMLKDMKDLLSIVEGLYETNQTI